MSEIYFKIAESDDYSTIIGFLRNWFYREEPITLAHPIPGHTEDDEEYTMSHLHHKTSLMALERETETLVGVLISTPSKDGDAVQVIRDARTRKWFDIARLLAYVEKMSDIPNKFDVNEYLQVLVVAVHSNFRGRKIGQKLFEECFRIAKINRFSLVSVDCSSSYSSIIAENLNMELVSRVPFEDYNKLLCGGFFKVNQPHDVIKTFVKKI